MMPRSVLRVKVHAYVMKRLLNPDKFSRFPRGIMTNPLEVLSIANIALGLKLLTRALHIIATGPMHGITVPPPNWLHQETREARKAGTLSSAPSQRF